MRDKTKKRICDLIWEDETTQLYSSYIDGIDFDEKEQCFRYYDDVNVRLTGYVPTQDVHKAIKHIWNELNEEEQKHFTAELLSGREV